MKGIAPLFVVLLIAVAVAVPAYFFLSQPKSVPIQSYTFAAGEDVIKPIGSEPIKNIPQGSNWDVQWADSKPKWFPYDNVPDDLGSYLSGGCWIVGVQNLDGGSAQTDLQPIIEGANFDNQKVEMTKLESLEMTTQMIEHPAVTDTKCEKKELNNKTMTDVCTVTEVEHAWTEEIDAPAWIPYENVQTQKTMLSAKANFGYDTLPAKGSADTGASKDGTKFYHLCYKLPFAMDVDYKLGVMLNGVEYHPLVNTTFNYQLNFSAYNSYDAELYGHTQNYVITATNLPADCLGQLYDSSDMSFLKYKVNATASESCTLTINHTFAPTSSANWTFVYGNTSEASFTDTATMGYKPAYSQLTEDFNGASWNANYDWVTTYCNGGTNDVTLDAGRLRTANCVVIINSSSTTNGSAAGLPSNDDLPWDMHFGVEVLSTNDYGGFMFGNASQMTQGTITRLFKMGLAAKLQLQKMSADAWTDADTYGVGTDFHFIINSTKFGAWKNSTVIYEDDSHGGNAWIGNLLLRSDVDTGGNHYTYLDYLYVGQPVTLVPSVGAEEAGNLIAVTINVPSDGGEYYAGNSIASNTTTTSVGFDSYQCYRRIDGGTETDIGIVPLGTTFMYSYAPTPAGTGTLNVTCVNGTTVGTDVSTYTVQSGIIPSMFYSNGTAVATWGLQIDNATVSYTNASMANGEFIDYTILPMGAVNVTFFNGVLQNTTVTATINADAVANVNAYAWHYDEFTAVDTDGGNVTVFSIYMTNGTNVATLATTTGTVTVVHSAIPWGNVNSTISASGYGTTTHTFSAVTSSTVLNYTYTMPIAGILVNTYNEKTGAQIYFNITIANSTNSNSWTDQLTFNKNWSVVPSGDVKVTITSVNGTNYYGRDYYVNLNTEASATINAYLLPIADGMIVRFHMMTTTGNSVSGAQITASKFMNTSWNSVGQAYSDNSGVAPLYLDPTTSYQFVVVYSGATVQQWTITPVQQDYYVYLTTSTGSNFSSQFNGIYMKLEPASRMMNNTGVQHINLTLSNNINNFTVWGWIITYTNGTRFVNENRTDPMGGILNFSMDMKGLSGYLNVTYYYNTNAWNISSTPPESYFEYRYEHIYPIWGVNPHTNNTIQGLFNSIKEYTSSGGTSGTPIGALGFGVAMIMMAAVGAGAVSSRFGMGGGGIFVLGILGFGTYVMSEIYPSGTITWTGIMIITTLATISAMWFRMRG